MSLALYVHIPYCLQRCHYCDFTTFEHHRILPPQQYVEWLQTELRRRHHLFHHQTLSSIYFGGGTPSLLDAKHILSILTELANLGFQQSRDCEITIEINPATIDSAKVEHYLQAGINRFSVGAQTFRDHLLQLCGRRHTAEDTRQTLHLLKSFDCNYSLDLLFALPGQTLEELQADLDVIAQFNPPHVSAYCLTVPEGHQMAHNRPLERDQVRMFREIEERLKLLELNKYEISNFARTGFESRHNLAYWRDQSYWGLGVSAHSYARDHGQWGTRFWNSSQLDQYGDEVQKNGETLEDFLPPTRREHLRFHEYLTDFCHTHFRMHKGLPEDAMRLILNDAQFALLKQRLLRLNSRGWLENSAGHWRLTRAGELISNQVFTEMTFLAEDLLQEISLWPTKMIAEQRATAQSPSPQAPLPMN